MSIEVDEKGKVFTHVVHKDIIQARIQTVTHLITGEIYLEHEHRIKDELGINEPFIAVTAAKVYAPDGTLAYEAPFITINRSHIVWLALEDEPRPQD